MMRAPDLDNRMQTQTVLTNRQQQVFVLVHDYYSVAHEMPSTGWISRRLNISRQRAAVLLDTLRTKQFLR